MIPARLGSTRLPSKPLRLLAGEPLISVVARRALGFGLFARVVVATDSQEVVAAVAHLPVEAALTAVHQSGTDRVAEVVARRAEAPSTCVINVQGDEPFVRRDVVEGVIGCLRGGAQLATAAVPLAAEDLTARNRVKVVVDGKGNALRFARDLPASAAWSCEVTVLRHLGVYGYTPTALAQWARLPPHPLEIADGLEQIRPLGHGMTMKVFRSFATAYHGIDTENDLVEAEAMLSLRERALG